YAVGESSCTGLHGANRLASNSLSECFVFARRAVDDALSSQAPSDDAPAPPASAQAPPVTDAQTRAALWRDAGVVRDEVGLRRLPASPPPPARLSSRGELARAESRGAHLRSDCPERDATLDHRHAVFTGDDGPDWQTWR